MENDNHSPSKIFLKKYKKSGVDFSKVRNDYPDER